MERENPGCSVRGTLGGILVQSFPSLVLGKWMPQPCSRPEGLGSIPTLLTSGDKMRARGSVITLGSSFVALQ